MDSLHIEPTSRCTVKCPLCPRTILIKDFGKKFLPIEDIDIDTLDHFLQGNYFTSILLCGTYGDALMHPDLEGLVKVCKKYTDSVQIATSGSGRSKKWWEKFINCLDERDKIDFAIDGTPDNFTEYRINARWDQIEPAIRIAVAQGVQTRWQFIPFDYNTESIESAKKLSMQLGMDEFFVFPSERIHPGGGDIIPRCKNRKLLYISASGQFMSCCHVHDFRYYYKSDWWKEHKKYNIATTTYEECARLFDNFYSTIQTNRYDYCTFACGKINE